MHPYGWGDRVAAHFELLGDRGAVPGRVVRVDGSTSLVATADGLVRATPFAAASRRAGLTEVPATGDWVAVAADPGEGLVMVAVVPRWSAISRKDPDENVTAEQVLAANVDDLAVVCALDRPIGQNRIERMLAAAWESGAVPIVVLTKADLADDPAAAVAEAEAAAGAVGVRLTSTVTGEGVEALRALAAPNRTLALIGPSGAGKSSLVNRLVGVDVQSTGAVREGDRRGRHTTTSRELVPLPSGGVLLDTPGLRSLPLWDAEAGVAATFDDIAELAAACRFRDCGHDGEPNCAVRAAVDAGTLPARRLASWLKLGQELAALELHRDEAARRAGARRFGKMAKQVMEARPGRQDRGPGGGRPP